MLIERVKQFLGVHPYNTDTNYLKNDGYCYYALIKDFGKEAVEEAIRKVKENDNI